VYVPALRSADHPPKESYQPSIRSIVSDLGQRAYYERCNNNNNNNNNNRRRRRSRGRRRRRRTA
jgi:hypothetical protein